MATGTVKWFNTTKGFGEYDMIEGRDGRASAGELKLL